ncbi:MAG TPA: malto-oligosyltrehalose synthase [Acidimicrobiales bacterium]
MERELIGTYRLQLQPGFGFEDAAGLIPYLADLGFSHLYLSPVFEAASGSTHGYDIVDPTRLRADLGGDAGFEALVETAHEHGLGVVIDIVPHHMAATADNAWWWSVLEHGESSPYAHHFDIDWDPPSRRLRGSVMLPVLGDHYGRVLDSGELHLERGKGDALVARYFDHVAPLSPETADELWAIAGRRGCDVIEVLSEVNGDPDRLDAILDRQHHRFARWQSAAHELDYRRFFDIDSLVAMRSERPEVFVDCHQLILRLVLNGAVDGLRVDHIDGLRDPAGYLEHLRSRAPEAWLVVEKILRPSERLPSWPVDGTTGYEFLALVGNLFVDGDGFDRILETYQRFIAHDARYEQVRLAARRDVLGDGLDADLERLVALLVRVCEGRRRWRDFTRAELREATNEVIVRVGAYRAYVRANESPSEFDQRLVNDAIDGVERDMPDLDADLLDLLRVLFTGGLTGPDEAEAVARFQQLTGPVAAKGEEDTAFYRWTPLLSLNEVGSEPDHTAVDSAAFHAECARRQQVWPQAMLTTSTHDTKRSEDVRARLALLSEIPDAWSAAVAHWSAINNHLRDVEADAPDHQDEWFIYQTLVGAHPLPVERAWPVVEKSLREAKRRTNWTRSDEHYERAVHEFVDAILSDDEFVADLDRFVAPLVDPGRINALAQVALRMLAPGVPDTYQGTELWDNSLVDPDNRRPVDYSMRTAMLSALDGRTDAAAAAWRDERGSGAPKLALAHACLQLRARHADSFGRAGTYAPLAVDGADAGNLVAFLRGEAVVAAVPRLPLSSSFADTNVHLPDGSWHNVLTAGTHAGGVVRFTTLSGDFPVVVLERT